MVGGPLRTGLWRAARRRPTIGTLQTLNSRSLLRSTSSPLYPSTRCLQSSSAPPRHLSSEAALPSYPSPTTADPPAPPPASTASSDPYDLESFVGMTGGEIFNDMMRRLSVHHIFGYPGGAILPVFDAIHESEHFQFVLSRHEQGAGHMAEGYARASGKPGVVLVTSGPGATNVVTPMQDALSDGTPMVVFSGQVPTTALGTDAFQEADIVGISRSCTKWNIMVRDLNHLPQRIAEAFEIATSGRPGPVLVDLPKDITAQTLRSTKNLKPPLPYGRIARYASRHQHRDPHTPHPTPGTPNLTRVADLIQQSKKPIIYAGQGMMNCTSLLSAFTAKTNIPVTTTLQGLGCFNEENPLSLHMLGMHGSVYANRAMQEADLILALGARFDDRVTGNLLHFAPAARKAEAEGSGGIVHFDIMPKNINKVVQVTLPIIGDVADNLATLYHMLPPIQPRDSWLAKLQGWKREFSWDKFADAPVNTAVEKEGGLKPQVVLSELNRLTREMKKDVVLTTGVGQHQMWAAQYYRWTHPRTFITSGGLGTMGFGLPSAIGAKIHLSDPSKIVIDIDGDASYCMTGMELMTASEYGVGVKVLILNNSFQGMVKQWQDLFYVKRYSGTKMVNPDFVKMAESFGVKGLRMTKSSELTATLQEFLHYDNTKPIVLDAQVLNEEHVYPMVAAGRALHEMELGPLGPKAEW